ncbi:MAG TPA: hypothetical protein VGE08_26155 [Steroidobacter sp.]|uniref:hypothetical protein n=1 Tax=Steroidobacter sp. TaxID=1978227 RepID=UPI002EDA2C10
MATSKTPLLFALLFIAAFANGGCKRGPLWPAQPVIPRSQSLEAPLDAGPDLKRVSDFMAIEVVGSMSSATFIP